MKNKILFLVMCLLILCSCRKNYKNIKYESGEVLACEALEVPMTRQSPRDEQEFHPKLIKKGDLTISATNIEIAKNLIYSFVKVCNGYISNENLIANEPVSYYQISLNIDASKYERFIYMLDSSKLNIVSRSFSVKDVTMQYADNSTRLENKRKLEKRYLDLLSKTKDIKDMLEIEEKLENIRTEIEVKENQLKILDKQISYSVFDITIQKTSSNITNSEKNEYSYKLGQGILAGWEGIKTFGIFLISIWPLYLVLLISYIILKKSIQLYRRNKNQ